MEQQSISIMEDYYFSIPMNADQNFELPPGFRFHPTDEELITHYLSQKVLDSFFSARAIGEVDLNKCEPWDLPGRAKMGEKEWYFFCVRDKKYPTGLRTNRATDAGYWKATGKDKEIYKAEALIGMKKTLVFYRGRAPRGGKTNWVMHEYRLEGKHTTTTIYPKQPRVFQKCEKKVVNLSSFGRELPLPPLMDCSPYNSETKTSTAGESSHVTCFSHQNHNIEQHDDMDSSYYAASNSIKPSVTISPAALSTPAAAAYYDEYPDAQDQTMLRMLIENHGTSTKQQNQRGEERYFGAEMLIQRSLFGNQEYSSPASLGHADSGCCLWNF